MGWEIMLMLSPTIYLLQPTCGLPLKLSSLVAYCNCNNSLLSVCFGSLYQLLLYPFGLVATATLISLVDCNCNIIAPGAVQSQYSLLFLWSIAIAIMSISAIATLSFYCPIAILDLFMPIVIATYLFCIPLQ